MDALRAQLRTIISKTAFDVFIYALIAANCATICARGFERTKGLDRTFDIVDGVIGFFYLAEAFVKLFAFGPRRYASSKWNLFDFAVSITSLIAFIIDMTDTSVNAAFGRIARVVRVVRLLSTSESLRLLTTAIAQSSKRLLHVVLLLTVFLTLISLFSLEFFKSSLQHRCLSMQMAAEIAFGTRQIGPFDIDDEVAVCRYSALPDTTDAVLAAVIAANGTVATADAVWALKERMLLLNNVDRYGRRGVFLGYLYPNASDLMQPEASFEGVYGPTVYLSPTGGQFVCPYGSVCTVTLSIEQGMTNFDSIIAATATLYDMMSALDAWTAVIYPLSNAQGWWVATLFFQIVLTVGNFFLLNLTLVIVLDAFERTRVLSSLSETATQEVLYPTPLLFENENIDHHRLLPNDAASSAAAPSSTLWTSIRAKFRTVRKGVRRYVLVQTWFRILTGTILVLNLAAESTAYAGMSDTHADILLLANAFFTVFYVVEVILKLLGFSMKLWKSDIFNFVDLAVTLAAAIELVASSTGDNKLSALRSLRLLKLLSLSRSLQKTGTTLLAAFRGSFALLLLVFLFEFIFAALGMQIFSGTECNLDTTSIYRVDTVFCKNNPRWNFDNMGYAIQTIFSIASSEAWRDMMVSAELGTNAYMGAIFFCVCDFLVAYLLVNLFVAVMINSCADVNVAVEEAEDDDFTDVDEADIAAAEGDEPMVAMQQQDGEDTEGDAEERPSSGLVSRVASTLEDPQSRFAIVVRKPRTSLASAARQQHQGLSRLVQSIDAVHRRREERELMKKEEERENDDAADAESLSTRSTLSRTYSLQTTSSTVEEPPQENGTSSAAPNPIPPASTPSSQWRQAAVWVYNSPFPVVLVLLSTCLCIAHHIVWQPTLHPDHPINITGVAFDVLAAVVFALESVVKLVAFGVMVPPLPVSREKEGDNDDNARPLVDHKDNKATAKKNKSHFFSSPWRGFELFTAAAALFAACGHADAFQRQGIVQMILWARILRNLRIWSFVRFSPTMYFLFRSVARSLPALRNAGIITFFFWFVYSVLGLMLFRDAMSACTSFAPLPLQAVLDANGGALPAAYGNVRYDVNGTSAPYVVGPYGEWGDRTYSAPFITTKEACVAAGFIWIPFGFNFDHIGNALLTMFQAATVSNWQTVMYVCTDTRGPGLSPAPNSNLWAPIYFMSFIVLMGQFLINFFKSALIDAYFGTKASIEMQYALLRKEREDVIARRRLRFGTRAKSMIREPEEVGEENGHPPSSPKWDDFVRVGVESEGSSPPPQANGVTEKSGNLLSSEVSGRPWWWFSEVDVRSHAASAHHFSAQKSTFCGQLWGQKQSVKEFALMLTASERRFFDLYRYALYFVRPPLVVNYTEENAGIRFGIRRIVRSYYFEIIQFVLALVHVLSQTVIFWPQLSGAIVDVKGPGTSRTTTADENASDTFDYFVALDILFNATFVVFLLAKLSVYGVWPFFEQKRNIVDLFVNIATAAGSIMCYAAPGSVFWFSTRALLFLRYVRIHYIFFVDRSLLVQFQTFIDSAKTFLSVLVLLLFGVFTFTSAGMVLFGRVKFSNRDGINRWANFESFDKAIFTLMRIGTTDNWGPLMLSASATAPNCTPHIGDCGRPVAAPIFFVIYMICGTWVGLNVFTAVLMEGFVRNEADGTFPIQEKDVRLFQRLWKATGQHDRLSGTLTLSELTIFLYRLPPKPLGIAFAPADIEGDAPDGLSLVDVAHLSVQRLLMRLWTVPVYALPVRVPTEKNPVFVFPDDVFDALVRLHFGTKIPAAAERIIAGELHRRFRKERLLKHSVLGWIYAFRPQRRPSATAPMPKAVTVLPILVATKLVQRRWRLLKKRQQEK